MFEEDYSKYRLFPLFVSGVFFVLAAPLFWLHSEFPTSSLISRGAENITIYNRGLPYLSHAFDRLRGGALPLWSDGQWCGIPFMGDPMTGVFQPLYGFFYLLPVEQAMAASAFAGLALMGIFFVVYARSLGLSYLSGLSGGIVYAFCGLSAAAMSHPENMATLAWPPLVFWGIREAHNQTRRAPLVLAALAMAFCLLGGVPALALPFAAVALLYFAVLHSTPQENRAPKLRQSAGSLLLFLAITAGVAAVQWTHSAAWFLQLADPWESFWRLSLAGAFPQDLNEASGQLLLAKSNALTPIYYVGIVALLTLLPGLFTRSGRTEFVFFMGLTPILIFLAWRGGEGPFPYTGLLYPASFGIATLIAIGADRLFIGGRDPRSVFVWMPILLFLLTACTFLAITSGKARGLLFLALLVTLPYFILRAGWMRNVSAALFAVCMFLDVLLATKNYYAHPYLDDIYPSRSRSAAQLVPLEEPLYEGKSLTLAHPFNTGFQPNAGLLSQGPAADGANIPLSRWQRPWQTVVDRHRFAQHLEAYQNDSGMEIEFRRALALAGVSTLHIAADHPFASAGWFLSQSGFRLQERNDAGQTWISDGDFPRAWFVQRWTVTTSPEEGLAGALDPDFDGRLACTVDANSPGFDHLARSVPQPPVVDLVPADTPCAVRQIAPEFLEIKVSAPAPGIVVLSDAFSPGWRVTVNKQAVPILRVNGFLRGITVPEGEHFIEMRYRPRALYAGFAVCFFTLSSIALWGLSSLLRRPESGD